jgi:hypothetical protein
MLILKLHWYLKLLEIAKVIQPENPTFMQLLKRRFKSFFYGNAATYHCKVVSPKREFTKVPYKWVLEF